MFQFVSLLLRHRQLSFALFLFFLDIAIGRFYTSFFTADHAGTLPIEVLLVAFAPATESLSFYSILNETDSMRREIVCKMPLILVRPIPRVLPKSHEERQIRLTG